MKTREEPSALNLGRSEGKFGGSLRLWKWSLNPTLKVFTAYPKQSGLSPFSAPSRRIAARDRRDELIWFIWSVWSIWSVWFNQINETNQTNQSNQSGLALHASRFRDALMTSK